MVEKFISELGESFAALTPNEYEAKQVRETLNTISNCLTYNVPPGDNFARCLSSGAFKEAYMASDSIIVKFCTCDNPTDKEAELLMAADDYGVGKLFVPTYFHKLPFPLGVSFVEDSNSLRYSYNSRYHIMERNEEIEDFVLTHLEIQPFVQLAIDSLNEEYDYIRKRPIPGIPQYIRERIKVSDCSWLSAIANRYGSEIFEKFVDFYESFGLYDLHGENIGYTLEGNPVIFDWMSK